MPRIVIPMTQNEISDVLEKAVRGQKLKVVLYNSYRSVTQPIIRKDETPGDSPKLISIQLLYNYFIFFNNRHPYVWACASKEQGIRYIVRVEILE